MPQSHLTRIWCTIALFYLASSIFVASTQGQDSTALKESQIRRITLGEQNSFPAAVRVTAPSFAHTTQLLPIDGSADDRAQCLSVLEQLDAILSEFGSDRSHVVQLNAYVGHFEMRRLLLERLSQWSPGKLPAVTCVATRLPDSDARVAVDAVFVSGRVESQALPSRDQVAGINGSKRSARVSLLPPGDVVYVSGQAEVGALAEATRSTLESLLRTLQHLKLGKEHIVQVKCFLAPMREVSVVNQQIAEFFGESMTPPVSHVEWISGSRPIEIELVAWAPSTKSTNTVTYETPPELKSSPVFSRVARIHGDDRIFVSGLYSQDEGTGETQVKDIFKSLEHILKKAGSDLQHLAKATYYVAAPDASSELNRLRPEYYHPQRPPAASKATVEDVAYPGRTITLDMIAAPAR